MSFTKLCVSHSSRSPIEHNRKTGTKSVHMGLRYDLGQVTSACHSAPAAAPLAHNPPHASPVYSGRPVETASKLLYPEPRYGSSSTIYAPGRTTHGDACAHSHAPLHRAFILFSPVLRKVKYLKRIVRSRDMSDNNYFKKISKIGTKFIINNFPVPPPAPNPL